MTTMQRKSKKSEPAADAVPPPVFADLKIPILDGVIKVKPDEIYVDGLNHRVKSDDDAARVAQIAESIAQFGQQQPALLSPYTGGYGEKEKKYRLVFGHVRREACITAGLPLEARVTERELTDIEIMNLRAVENLDKDGINAVEECLAVSRLFTAFENDGADGEHDLFVEAVATRLRREPQWVRDRLYVHRLPEDVKDLVASGELPLAYARELAKVADTKKCGELADDCLTRRSDGPGEPRRVYRSLDWLRNQVRAERFSLRVVPWKVETPFAGKPACLDCPFNTANDMALFEHDGKADQPEILVPKGMAPTEDRRIGVCTNKTCHTHKLVAARKAIGKGVAKVKAAKKQNKDLQAGAVALEAAGLMPAGVKPSSFARAAGIELGRGSTPKRTEKGDEDPDREPGSGSKRTPMEVARDEHRFADRRWGEAAIALIIKELNKTPHRRALAFAIFASSPWQLLNDWNVADKQVQKALANKPLRAAIAALKNPIPDDLFKLLQEEESVTAADPFADFEQASYPILSDIATALGMTLVGRPKVEDFLPKAEKPAAKTPGKKKAKKGGGK